MFSKVIGNRRNIGYLEEAARAGKLAHAYIINGEKGSGKKTLASFIAAGLLCEKHPPLGQGPCGVCPACIKSASGNHPDLIRVTHEKETVLSVDEVRAALVDDAAIKPFYGPYKIYIIEDAQLMSESAQNALLKTIEEPPEYAVVFLLSETADALLDTIRSRCIRLDMERLGAEDILQNIEAQGKSESEIRAAAAFSGGNLGKAVEVLASEGLEELIENITGLLADIENADAAQLYAAAAEIEKARQQDVLEIIRKWYRDALMLRACPDVADGVLYFPQQAPALKALAQKASYEALNNAFLAADSAQDKLRANVKADAVFEVLFLALRRSLKH